MGGHASEGCGGHDFAPQPAETILLARRVISMQPDAAKDLDCVVIRGNRIIRVMRRDQMAEMRGPNTRVIDLGERVLLPGFVDVHAHSEVACRTAYETIDIRAPECGSIADVSDAFRTASAGRDRGDWLVGQGNLFFDRKLKEGRMPTREDLDKISRDTPIAVRAGGHITVLNSKGLEVAGIDRNYVPPAHSITGPPQVERDASGNPTGVVKEMDSILPFAKLARSQVKAALKEGLRQSFTEFGVTTIGEISESVEGIECLNDLAETGELPVSYRIYLWAPGTMKLLETVRWRNFIQMTAPDSLLRIQGVKLFSDGGYSAKSAAISCPYAHSGSCGHIAFPGHFFKQAYQLTQEAGLQLAVHANGDRAQEWLCEQLIALGGSAGGRTRLRIEHAGNYLPHRRTSDLWADAGIIPVPQPVFIYTFGEYFADYLGEPGKIGRFPLRSLIDMGWRLSGSSDVWIGSEREATNPLFSIWCCLKRQAYSGMLIDPHEAVTLEQALRMHTLDAAATMGEDDVRGSIAPGKFADIIALERDPFAVEVDELRKLKVDFVMSHGRVVLDRGTEKRAAA
jgi:predicted amidohydrolase YtcJ